MQGPIEWLSGRSWSEFVQDIAVDTAVQWFTVAMGVFYAACFFIVIFVKKLPVFFRFFLWLGAAGLLLLAFIYTKDQFYHTGQFFEYALQFGAPAFLLIALKTGGISDRLVFWMKLATAITFACHGLYAIGYYPRPGTFLDMTIRITGLSQQAAIQFLNIAGVLDFVVAIGIFLPVKWARWFLLYAAGWGLLTSLARPVGNFFPEFALLSLHQWVHEMVFRLPHFIVPLLLFLKLPTSPPISTNQD